MHCRALLLGLLFAIAARADAGIEVIDEETLKPQFEELGTRVDHVKKGQLKIEEMVLYYQQQALLNGTPRQRAISAYFYGFVLRMVPDNQASKDVKRQMQTAIDLMPGFLPAYGDLALLAETTGDKSEAERLLRRALEIKPSYVRAIIQRGQMAAREGDYVRAKALYNKSLDIKPTVEAFSALVVVNIALFRKSYDDREKEQLAGDALQAAASLCTLEPDNQMLRLGKAQVLVDLGRVDDAIKHLENLFAEGTLRPQVQLELLKFLRQVYQAQNDVEGVSRTIDRLLKCEALRPEERARITGRQGDVKAMGRNAFVKWQIEDRIQILHNEGLSVAARKQVQAELHSFIAAAQDIPELKPLVWEAWCECFRVLVDSPPELIVAQLRWMRNNRPPPRFMAVLVHFVHPGGKTEDVREEGVRAAAACAGTAAIPSIYYSLQDDSGRVVREVDNQLATLCGRRSPLAGNLDPYTPDQVRQARLSWAAYFHTTEGADRLAKAFLELRDAIARVQPDRQSAPMIDHAANVILDDDVPWQGWSAAYDFLVCYWGKEFRPVERRGKPVEPFEREHVVKAFQENYRGRLQDPDDETADAQRDASMPKGK